ncbi:DUF4153 domain-containing protein [Arundinibacter roseus]|uniref:DUF4153 domain-containing protein n=1 Tax=Arundinibacter roseus TaxID=2070510 RepID=A0A4R4KQS8_9BACT|nr:DUF4153 domain-containing protein [Arundinibacter roseus]TDB68989.1 DUF4153 domain-containing protein [Arundinibacter roseus]
MLRLPSVKNLMLGLQQVLTRFPWVVFAAALKVSAVIFLVENSVKHEFYFLFVRLTLLLFLAIPLFLSLTLVAERRQWKAAYQILAGLGIVALLVLFFMTMEPTPIQRDYYRFGMFLVCAHLLVSFAPFIGFDEPNGFWQFNKTMLLQFLTATLYAGTLFLGLIIAIETVRFLFDVPFSSTFELNLFLIIAGFFHTIFFLNGFPARLETLENQTTYSKSVKLFTQYVLLPLEVIYLIILYVYFGKILVQWQLPQGGVAYLVMAFSVAGILALLLLFPLRNQAEERWIRLFTRRFHLALFPLIILLFVAIFRRINDYGITENRYLVAALAVWLAGISLYLLFSKKDDIRWIPLSLCVVSFLLAVGPWSIFSVSRRHQAQRFEKILKEYNLLSFSQNRNGKIDLTTEKYEQLISGIHYFRNRRELSTLTPFFTSLPAKSQEAFTVANAMEAELSEVVDVKTPVEKTQTFQYYGLAGADQEGFTIDIKGYNYLWGVEFNGEESFISNEWTIKTTEKGALVTVLSKGSPVVVWNVAERLAQLQPQYGDSSYELTPEELTFSHTGLKLVLKNANKQRDIYNFQGFLLRKK